MVASKKEGRKRFLDKTLFIPKINWYSLKDNNYCQFHKYRDKYFDVLFFSLFSKIQISTDHSKLPQMEFYLFFFFNFSKKIRLDISYRIYNVKLYFLTLESYLLLF